MVIKAFRHLVTPSAEEAYAHYKNLIRQKIRIGTQDLKIAAIALSVEGIVVTRNQKDFGKVPDLRLQDWTIQNE